MVLRTTAIAILVLTLQSCGNQNESTTTSDAELSLGEDLYNNNCAICHGADGKLGAGGATDLSTSTLSAEEMNDVIEKGRGAMPAQMHVFSSKKEINEVVDFVLTLK